MSLSIRKVAAVSLALCSITTAESITPPAGESFREITWKDLLPKDEEPLDDPFTELTEDQLYDLGIIARIRFLLESNKTDPDGEDAKEEKKLVARLTEQGIDVDWILAQRERVAEMRRKRAEAVDDSVDGKRVRIPGYMLPLRREGAAVTEFLLVPWVGACIHTPPPPPNQMVHVSIPDGTEDRGRFAAVWLSGQLSLKPAVYELFLVDGKRDVNVAYTLTPGVIAEYSSTESDALANIEAPAFNPEHSWWQNLQTRVSVVFTKTMTDIRDRKSSGPLWFGLLVAFLYGVVHTLGPGHGKAVVVSYFIGEGGNIGRGLKMGIQIAIFHVLSAIVVVLLTDFAVRQATGNAPSDYRAVRLISYAAIAAIGAAMLWKVTRNARLRHNHGDGAHASHSHGEEKATHHHEGCHACEVLEKRKSGVSGWLSLAIGAVPCTGALLVLLFGMANDLLAPAVLMVIAISAGMAIAMSTIGVIAICGRSFVGGRMEGNPERRHRFANGARIAGATLVLLIGLGLFTLAYLTPPLTPQDSSAASPPGSGPAQPSGEAPGQST